jgi:hypothetical protein
MARHANDDFSFLPTVDSMEEKDALKEQLWPATPPTSVPEEPEPPQQEVAEADYEEPPYELPQDELSYEEERYIEEPPPVEAAASPAWQAERAEPAPVAEEQPAKTPAKVSLRPMAAPKVEREETFAPVIPRRAEPRETPALSFGGRQVEPTFVPISPEPLTQKIDSKAMPPPIPMGLAPVLQTEEPDFPPGLATAPEVAPADNSKVIKKTLKYAFFITIGLHLAAFLILALKHVPMLFFTPPEIVATSEVEHLENESWKKVTAAAPQTSAMAASISPLLSTGVSDIAMPEVDFSATASDLNLGTSFGSFGSGVTTAGAGGKVSFLGNTATAKHVVFVVDVSGSMSASMNVGGSMMTRFDLLKKELIKSISSLAAGTAYQVIFFSDFAWPHDVVDSNDMRALNAYDWKISAMDRNAKIPRFSYLAANPVNISKSKKIIAEANNPGGTNWGSGLMMALKGSPKPDVIFFMTDGNRSDEQGWIDAVTTENSHGKRTIIHTTALGTPDAARDLDMMAKRNGGKFTAVMADGKIIQGKDLLP